MEPNHFDRNELEKLLSNTAEPEAPSWLLQKIMAEIDDRRPSLFERIRQWWLRPRSVSVVPGWLAVTVTVAICAFWLGTITVQQRKAEYAVEPGTALPALGDNAEANYLIGRGLLAAGHQDQALAFLRQAVQQEPGMAEFAHWQGVAYWALGESDKEQQSYLSSTQEQPDYVPSLLNLGHNYLDRGEYRQALMQYEKVLQVDPLEASALYNRALTFQMLKDDTRAEQSFIKYLDHYRKGKWVFRAIEHLHQLGNFTFRSYRIGENQVALNTAALLGSDTSARQREIMVLTEALSQIAASSELHVVVYNQGNRSSAKATATALQSQLKKYLGDGHAIAVRGSWFDVAETFADADGFDRQLTESLLIFTRSVEHINRRNSI